VTIRVLVADDQAMIRGALAGLLDLERDIEVVAQAADGAQALEKLGRLADSSGLTRANAPADVAIIDIEMPRMDGFEVAIQIRHNKRLQHIPIIMITSRTGEKHRERALEIGVNDYMGKPFQENQLLNKIQTLLGEEVSLIHEG